jgi:ubiquinone/menaquinone biosynthesis C-methylase UbiE
MVKKVMVLVYKYVPDLYGLYRKMEYELISRVIKLKKEEITFMNYGYDYDEKEKMPRLEGTEEKNRYSIQLYHFVSGHADFSGRKSLEVGSGRGGGADYVLRTRDPKMMYGLDVAQNAVDFCNDYYDSDKIRFFQGSAQEMPFEKESFDIVFNVESSHCYPEPGKFFSEVARVLKPGGYFLYTDRYYGSEWDEVDEALNKTELKKVKEVDISGNVLNSLEKDEKRKLDIIEKLPGIIQKPFMEFAGVKESGLYKGLNNGEIAYKYFVYQK